MEKPGPPHLTWKISQNIEPHTKHLTNIARDCFSSQAGDLVRDCKDCQVSVMSPSCHEFSVTVSKYVLVIKFGQPSSDSLYFTFYEPKKTELITTHVREQISLD